MENVEKKLSYDDFQLKLLGKALFEEYYYLGKKTINYMQWKY